PALIQCILIKRGIAGFAGPALCRGPVAIEGQENRVCPGTRVGPRCAPILMPRLELVRFTHPTIQLLTLCFRELVRSTPREALPRADQYDRDRHGLPVPPGLVPALSWRAAHLLE